VLTGETNGYYEDFGSIAQLAKALRTPFVYDGIYSRHRGRTHGRPPIGLNGHHFVVCTQNHDQIGNRAQGERLAHLVDRGRQKIAAALLLTSAYVPLIFQGEEFAASTPFLYFSSHEEEELGRAVSIGRTHEFAAFGWEPEQVPDPQERRTFQRSKLRWKEVDEPQHADVLEWYRKLIRMRPELGLTDGQLDRVEVDFDERARWIRVRRGCVEVVANLGADRHAVPVTIAGGALLYSEDGGYRRRPGLVELTGNSVAILIEETKASPSTLDLKTRLGFVSTA
jgi:maltooligosyltrehalose trehalohydrolase